MESSAPPPAVMPRESGGIQSSRSVLWSLDRPPEPVTGPAFDGPVGGRSPRKAERFNQKVSRANNERRSSRSNSGLRSRSTADSYSCRPDSRRRKRERERKRSRNTDRHNRVAHMRFRQ